MKLGKAKEAGGHADILIKTRPRHPRYLDLKGLVLLKQNKPANALRWFQKALVVRPDDGERLLYAGVTLSMAGRFQEADKFLKRAHRLLPNDLSPLFRLVENEMREGDVPGAEKWTDRLLATGSIIKIEDIMNKAIHHELFIPLSHELVGPVLKRKINEKTQVL